VIRKGEFKTKIILTNDKLKTIWKWTKFSAWIVWFFLTFPWQMKKAYGQFLHATSSGTYDTHRTLKMVIEVTPDFTDNLN
jgi:hypothetical protein